MPSSRKQLTAAARAVELVNMTRNNPYIQRLIQDGKLRAEIRSAVESSRSAYARLSNGKVAHRALLEDKKLQADLQHAVEALREVTVRLTEPPKPKRKRHFGRRLMIVFLGAALALALSETLRSKVLDALFGAEEEFQYSPPPGAATTPPASPVTAA